MSAKSREADRLAEEAEKQGFTVRTTAKNHYLISLNGRHICDLSRTPSSPRSIPNTRAMLKRAGFNPNPKQRKH